MRVFLAGASGAIGRPLVPKLIAAGHEVTGMTRSEARAEEMRAGRRRRGRRGRVRRRRAARRDRGGAPGGDRPRAHGPAGSDRLPQGGHLRGHQPRPDRGHAQPDRRGRGRRRPAPRVPEHRVRLPPRTASASRPRTTRSSRTPPGRFGSGVSALVIHQLTALPDRMDFRKKDLYTLTNRLRTEGTRNLLRRPRSRARRFVSQSIAFAYRNDGSLVKTEDEPLLDDAPAPFEDGITALTRWRPWCSAPTASTAWCSATASSTARAPTTPRTALEADVRRRRLPMVGKGTGVFSFIHVDDAADATVAAVERGAAGVYNVTDDEPAAMSEWVPVLAEAVGAKRPRRVPVWLAKLVAGKEAATSPPSCAARRTRRRSASSAGSPPTRAGAAASRSRWRPSSRASRRAAGRSSPRRSSGCPPRSGSST